MFDIFTQYYVLRFIHIVSYSAIFSFYEYITIHSTFSDFWYYEYCFFEQSCMYILVGTGTHFRWVWNWEWFCPPAQRVLLSHIASASFSNSSQSVCILRCSLILTRQVLSHPPHLFRICKETGQTISP